MQKELKVSKAGHYDMNKIRICVFNEYSRLYSGKAVASEVSNRLSSESALNCVGQVKVIRIDENIKVILHNDCSVQYKLTDYADKLKEHQRRYLITGNPWDNAVSNHFMHQ